MKLFYSPGACSLAPHIVACELGLQFESVKVDLKAKKYAEGDYWKINANGYVPALQLDGGEILTEVGAILQYLADQKPEKGLAPKAGTFERVRAYEWLNFISTELHKGFGQLFASERLVASAEGREQFKAAVKEKLAQRLGYVSERLTDNFMTGENFTIVDSYLYTVLRWAPRTGVDLSRWPSLEKFMGRVNERPMVQKALADEGVKA